MMHTTVDFRGGIESFRDAELGPVLAERAGDILSLRVTGELLAVEFPENADQVGVVIEELRVVFHAEPTPWDGRGDEDSYYDAEEDTLFAQLETSSRSRWKYG